MNALHRFTFVAVTIAAAGCETHTADGFGIPTEEETDGMEPPPGFSFAECEATGPYYGVDYEVTLGGAGFPEEPVALIVERALCHVTSVEVAPSTTNPNRSRHEIDLQCEHDFFGTYAASVRFELAADAQLEHTDRDYLHLSLDRDSNSEWFALSASGRLVVAGGSDAFPPSGGLGHSPMLGHFELSETSMTCTPVPSPCGTRYPKVLRVQHHSSRTRHDVADRQTRIFETPNSRRYALSVEASFHENAVDCAERPANYRHFIARIKRPSE